MSDLLDEILAEKKEMRNRPFRKGDFGYHCTTVGKITYQRPKHYFTKKDWERIGKKYYVELVVANEPETPTAPWWMTLLKNYTLDMLDELFNQSIVLKALNINPEIMYYEIQAWSTEIGLKWALQLQRDGRMREADLVYAAFRPYSFGEAVGRK